MFESHKNFALYAALTAILILSVVATGCGGGAGSASSNLTPTTPTTPAPTPTPQASTANLAVNIGDAVAERVLAFELTVTSISLTKSDGSTVSVFSGSRRIEVTHLAGTFAPFALSSVPAGTYSSATVTVTDAEVSFLDSSKSLQRFEDKTLSRTISIPFSPALVVTASKAAVINIDVNAATSVLIDLASNSVTVNPEMLHKSGQVPETEAEAENEVEPENGELEHISGAVTAIDVQGGTFKMAIGQSALSMTFKTDASTKFEINDTKGLGLPALATGMLVRVEGFTLPDGTAKATEVEATVAVATGAEAEGIVTSTTGSPVTSFNILAQDGSGSGMAASAQTLGTTVSVSLASNSKFVVDAGKLTIDSAAFPFDASHLTAGQRVEADSEAEMQAEAQPNDPSAAASAPSGLLTGKKIKLQNQALVGTVSSFTGSANAASFILKVNADSAFALLTGQTSIQVQTQAATVVKNTVTLPPASATSQIRVRGLLFFTGTGYKMAASRIDLP